MCSLIKHTLVSIQEVANAAKLKNLDIGQINFEDVAICTHCCEILFIEDEAYEAKNGKTLCTKCSCLCEYCEEYFIDEEMTINKSKHYVCTLCAKDIEKREIIIKPASLGIELDSLEEAIVEKISSNTGYCHTNFGYTIVVHATLDVPK